MRRLLWRLLGLPDDPRPPGASFARWPEAPEAMPVWRGAGDRARLDPHFIDFRQPCTDDGRQPGEFQQTDR